MPSKVHREVTLRSQKRAKRAPTTSSPVALSRFPFGSTPSLNVDDDEDDPLALSPLLTQHEVSKRRRLFGPVPAARTTRRAASAERRERAAAVLSDSDLVPPSSEDEFESWYAERVARMHHKRGDWILGKDPPENDDQYTTGSDPESSHTSQTLSRTSTRSLSATPVPCDHAFPYNFAGPTSPSTTMARPYVEVREDKLQSHDSHAATFVVTIQGGENEGKNEVSCAVERLDRDESEDLLKDNAINRHEVVYQQRCEHTPADTPPPSSQNITPVRHRSFTSQTPASNQSTIFFSPQLPSVSAGTSRSPLIEAQPGSYNEHLLPDSSRPPGTGLPDVSWSAGASGDHGIIPSPASIPFQLGLHPSQRLVPPDASGITHGNDRTHTSASQFHALPAASSPMTPPVSPGGDRPSPVPVDPALAQFRITRTFRTRTTLQLQPYTRERQIYAATLRRGGLKKVKHAIVRAKEVSSDEEDDEEEAIVASSSSAELDPAVSETIIIPNTAFSKPRNPVEITEADRDEYFEQFGASPKSDDEDGVVMGRLQNIARRRRREEKADRKKQREKDQARRQFERFLHGADREQRVVDKNERSRREAAQNESLKTPSRPKVYRRRTNIARIVSPDPLSDPLGSDIQTVRPPSLSPSATSNIGGPQTSFRTPLSPSEDNETGDFVAGHDCSVYDIPPAERRRSPPVSSDNRTDSDDSQPKLDRRARIARRMLPAAMLRRLEREEAERDKRRADSKRRKSRPSESPTRPGRAVVRRHEGQVDVVGFLNEVVSSQEEASLERLDTPPPARMLQRELIVISDDEDTASSSSEAVEDNAPAETLTRLYEGDFESIIGGRVLHHRPRTKSAGLRLDVRPRFARGHRGERQRRPAVRLAKRTTIPTVPTIAGGTTMVQTRLEFAAESRESSNTGRKKRQPVSSKPKPRPAIRLDDHVIFSTADFAFEDSLRETRTPRKAVTAQVSSSRSFKRTVSGKYTNAQSVDVGVGKARSWANFDHFPIDFDISPLPSGLYCGPATVVGSGAVSQLVQLLTGQQDSAAEIIPTVSAYSVTLRWDLSTKEIVPLVPILFESMFASLAFAQEAQRPPELDLSPFAFLGPYVSSRLSDEEECLFIWGQVQETSAMLDTLSIASKKQARESRAAILQLRWHLFELSCRLSVACPTDNAGVRPEQLATSLVSQLLRSGFDKTIRPLKQILRGEVDSAEIHDISIAIWIGLIHSLDALDRRSLRQEPSLITCLDQSLGEVFSLDLVGPIAAERIWCIIFGLCALSQFEENGQVMNEFHPAPRWSLVRRAVSLIKISHNEEAEESAHLDQLRGRDKYIRVMMARCVRLSAVWRWHFDRGSFSIASKDLGVIFKERQHRNLPTEAPVDYPDFITSFDMSLTAAEDTRHESAFELYLRLICVAASDIIAAAQSLSEAQQAERDVQRFIMSIIPVSPVKFSRILPPSPRQLGQLVNRYSTMVAACYFTPSLLHWLLANSRKWASFEQADFDSRQISIRGLMYLAVVCRHHGQSVQPVVTRLGEMLSILQQELDQSAKPSARLSAPSRVEVERTMVLIVACFRHIIIHHSFDPEEQAKPTYPDPCLLHESWTARVFALDLANDLKCGNEIVQTIQTYLDTRAAALPRLARQRRQAREAKIESFDEYSLGIVFDDADLAALGGEDITKQDPVEKLDEEFTSIINTIISPRIYRLLSDMLPGVIDEEISAKTKAERQAFISRITKCWSDCAGVLVVERDSPDGWTPYIGSHGKLSWQRIHNDAGRLQVGLHFMLNVAEIDSGCFLRHEQEFVTLIYQTVATDTVTIEHQFLAATLRMIGGAEHVLLRDFREVLPEHLDLDRDVFLEYRRAALEAVFSRLPALLSSTVTLASLKALVYRCINLLVSSLVSNEKSIDSTKVIHKQSYHAFADTLVRALSNHAGDFINHSTVPSLKHFHV